MNNIENILRKYTKGEITLGQANADLRAAGSDTLLDPGKNTLTPAELEATKVGKTPAEANGYGLATTGTGTRDKVHVINGVLTEGGNEVLPNGKVDMDITVYIGGQKYSVKGKKLVTWRPEGE